MKIDAWTGPGGLLGEALGVILGPKAAWDSKKEPGGQNVYTSGPTWRQFFEFFRDLLILFCALFSSLRFGRYQNRVWIDFGRFLAYFFEAFLHDFSHVPEGKFKQKKKMHKND